MISCRHLQWVVDRDRGTPRGAVPPGIRVTYNGGSTGFSFCGDINSGQAECTEEGCAGRSGPRGCEDMRRHSVGELAATAAWNFETPRRRSSYAKRNNKSPKRLKLPSAEPSQPQRIPGSGLRLSFRFADALTSPPYGPQVNGWHLLST